MWDDGLRNINLVACTPQVLLNALIRGFMHIENTVLPVLTKPITAPVAIPQMGPCRISFLSPYGRGKRVFKYPKGDGQPGGHEESGRSAIGDCRNAGLSWQVKLEI